MEGTNVYLDFFNLKIALANSISQLVVLLGLWGKINLAQVALNSVLFNLMWNLNYFVCVLLQFQSPDNRIFDDYQITMVYLFGASYGFLASLIYPKPANNGIPISSPTATLLSLIGTFFLFLSFCVTSTFFSLKNDSPDGTSN